MCYKDRPIDIMNRLTSAFRRFGASNGATPGPIGPASSVRYSRACSTHLQTVRTRPGQTDFSRGGDPHRSKSTFIERSMLQHLNDSLHYDLWIRHRSLCHSIWNTMMLEFLTCHVYFRFYCRKPEYQIFPDTLYLIYLCFGFLPNLCSSRHFGL